MDDQRLRFILDFVAQTAGLKNAQELAEQLGTELDDTQDAGTKMAAALKAAADKASQDLEETIAIADRLGEALGPELTSKVNVDEIAGKMRQVGITTEDVEANIDSFRQSLSQMAATADTVKARVGDVDTAVQRVGDTSTKARSATANFAGNLAQELPGISAAMGPLNMGISQLVEGLAEGDINSKALIGSLATMAIAGGVVALAMGEYADEQKRAAEVKAFRADVVKTFTSALREGTDATAALIDHLNSVGKVALELRGVMGDAFSGDVADEMARAGVTLTIFAEATTGGAEGMARLEAALHASNAEAGDAARVMLAVREYQDMYTQSTKTAAAWSALNADAVERERRAQERLAEHLSIAEKTRRSYTRAVIENRVETERFQQSIERDRSWAQTQQSIVDTQETLDGYKQAVADGTMSQEEASRRSVIAIDDQKLAVLEYATQVLGLPASQVTNILADVEGVDDLQRLIEKLEQLERINRRMNGDPNWMTPDGIRPGGSSTAQDAANAQSQPRRDQRYADAEDSGRPIVVQIVVDDRTVQSITARQRSLGRGVK
ncbi:MAG: hypothetical protein Q7V57_11285 [Actinomycetota bacterium]|nr:hypothetical protein [Actinomycetota bacterium]